MAFHIIHAAILGLFVASCQAALSMSNIANECADASGYQTCYSQALGNAETCYKNNCEGQGTCTDENDCTASDPNCVTSCSCVAYSDMIQCAVTHCWNMVFTCEYQHLAISAVENCPIALGDNPPSNNGWVWLPYFPSNPSRQASCSCDMGWVYLYQYEAFPLHTACYNNYAKGVTSKLYECDCCQASATASGFYNMCPDTDPNALLSDGDMPQFSAALGELGKSQCASILPSTDCQSLGWSSPNDSATPAQFFAANDLPANGTGQLSRLPGTISTPLYPTITWALGAGQSVYTAIAVTTGSPGGGGSASGTSGPGSAPSPSTSGSPAGGGSGSGSSASGSAAAPSTTGHNGGGRVVGGSQGYQVWAVAFVVILAILL